MCHCSVLWPSWLTAAGPGWLILAVVALAATACGAAATPSPRGTATPVAERAIATAPPTAAVFFPQQAPVQGDRATAAALLEGELVVVDRCLRVKAAEGGASYLLVWPPDVALHAAQDVIQVRNAAGEVVAQVGQQVRLSGGESHTAAEVERLGQPLRQPLPDACSGPYWLVGHILAPSAPS